MTMGSDRLPTRPVRLRWLPKGFQNVIITTMKKDNIIIYLMIIDNCTNQLVWGRSQAREGQLSQGTILTIPEQNARQADGLQNKLQVSSLCSVSFKYSRTAQHAACVDSWQEPPASLLAESRIRKNHARG